MSNTPVRQLLQIGLIYKGRGRFRLAEDAFKQALHKLADGGEFQSSETALALFHLGEVFLAMNEPMQAVPHFKMAIRVWESLIPNDMPPRGMLIQARTYLEQQAQAIVTRTLSTVDRLKHAPLRDSRSAG